VFQRFITDTLDKLNFIFVYIDDILIILKSIREHLEYVRLVFLHLKAAGLMINKLKSLFFYDRVKFLGFFITQQGYKVDPEKVRVIKDILSLKTIKHIYQFVSMVNFLCQHIPQLSKLLALLNELIKNKKKLLN
jgi:hypothetical protein